MSYARFVHYVFARCQANNVILSPIHYDSWNATIPGRTYNEACNYVIDRWGRLPFGTLLSANSNPSTYADFGGPDECRWIDLHQIGNTREHHWYWWLTEIHRLEPAQAGAERRALLCGALPARHAVPLAHDTQQRRGRSHRAVGPVRQLPVGGNGRLHLRGGRDLAVRHRRRGAVHDVGCLPVAVGFQVQHLRSFAMVKGTRYRALVPEAEHVVPNKTGPALGYTGWAYAAATAERDWFMLDFEPGAAIPAVLRGARYGASYRPSWFDPRSGAWQAPLPPVAVGEDMLLRLPAPPDDQDWGLMLDLA